MDWKKFGEAFRDRPGQMWLVVLIIAVSMVVLALILHYLFSLRGRQSRGTRRQFRMFADANNLTGEESRLLLQVARACRLEDPSLIFVSRTLFENSVGAVGFKPSRVDAVRQKVYGA